MGQIRRKVNAPRESFLWDMPAHSVDAYSLLAVEYTLGELAARRTGASSPPTLRWPLLSDSSRGELVHMLNEGYVEYGISSGMHQTKQLVRDFEKQVVEQSKPQSRER